MRKKKGFTLIETLVATLLMTASLGALAHSLSHMRSVVSITRNQDIAISAAQEKMEEIANSEIVSVVANYNGHTFEVQDESSVDLLPVTATPGLVTAAGVAGISDLYDVAVTVSWDQGGRAMSKTISTTFVAKE